MLYINHKAILTPASMRTWSMTAAAEMAKCLTEILFTSFVTLIDPAVVWLCLAGGVCRINYFIIVPLLQTRPPALIPLSQQIIDIKWHEIVDILAWNHKYAPVTALTHYLWLTWKWNKIIVHQSMSNRHYSRQPPVWVIKITFHDYLYTSWREMAKHPLFCVIVTFLL